VRESELKKLYTFPFQSFSTDSGVFANLINGIWDPLTNFFPLPLYYGSTIETDYEFISNSNNKDFYPLRLVNGRLFRKIKTEVERYQRWRFHKFENSKLATEAIPREKSINLQVSKELITSVNKRKLPLVDIKPTLTTQHIVLVKNYEYGPNQIKFLVYDSNHPEIDNYFTYDTKDKQFRATDIIKRFKGIKNPDQNVSVYIVDEEDHDKIGDALLNYYLRKCN
jgi:hypothetical protein